jgi:hypothetical protein
MDLPDIVILLIGVVLAVAAFVVHAMNRKRDHPLRDRFEEFKRRRNRRDEGRD